MVVPCRGFGVVIAFADAFEIEKRWFPAPPEVERGLGSIICDDDWWHRRLRYDRFAC